MLTIWKRIAALFGGNRLERELNEELETHLAMQEEEFRARGMSPRAARMAARREFGGVAQTAEAYRERRGLPWIETAVMDLRYGLRGLRRNPGFTVAAVVSLAMGIGANAALFSVLDALLLKSAAVREPGRLVRVLDGETDALTYAQFRNVRRAGALVGAAAMQRPFGDVQIEEHGEARAAALDR